MNIGDEISKSQALLITMPGADYSKNTIEIVKKINGTICYVTLNKTADSLSEIFKKNKINMDNIVFIDAITKTFRNVSDQADHCYFISSPGNLTELSIAINRLIRHKFDYVIFDSLTSLLIYEKKAPVARFVSSIVNMTRNSNAKIILYALSVDEQSELINEAGMFVDKVIKLTK